MSIERSTTFNMIFSGPWLEKQVMIMLNLTKNNNIVKISISETTGKIYSNSNEIIQSVSELPEEYRPMKSVEIPLQILYKKDIIGMLEITEKGKMFIYAGLKKENFSEKIGEIGIYNTTIY